MARGASYFTISLISNWPRRCHDRTRWAARPLPPSSGSVSIANAFSKKVENHAHAVALHMMFYNFCRIHKTLRVTPAMAANVTDRLMTMDDVVALIDAAAPAPAKRGPYKKQAAA